MIVLLCALIGILFGFALWFAHWYFTVRYYEKYLGSIPHPPLTPLLGNALDFTSAVKILPTLMKYHRDFNGNFKIYLGSRPYVFFVETKDVECLLNSTTILKKSEAYRFLHKWLGTGLLTGWGEKWRKHRKIITPAFHFQILEEFIDVFNSAGDTLIEKLTEESKKSSFDVYPFITRCTLDIICETAMGTSVNAQNDADSKYVESVDILLEAFIERVFSPLLHHEFLYRFSKLYQIEQEALKVLHGYSRKVITKRKEEFLKNRDDDEALVDTLGRKKKKVFLDLLLEYSSKDPTFTYEDICEEVDTFMFEGHDTTATSISFALFLLAANPEVQAKAVEEQKSIFQDDISRSITANDLRKMTYLKMVIMEALRVYPSIPVYGRCTEQETELNGLRIPKDTMIKVFAYCFHRNPAIYPEPEKFNPERFNPENVNTNSPFAFLPFSAGPRNCIGQKFSLLLMQSVLSKILRSFELRRSIPEHEIILKSEAVLKADNGVFIRVVKKYQY